MCAAVADQKRVGGPLSALRVATVARLDELRRETDELAARIPKP